MALSDTFTRNVGDHWRVRCVWTGSQSISGNYTDITMKTYWESTDSYGTTYTTDTKSGTSRIDGKSESFSFSAKLTGKQSKLVKEHTERVTHNAEGKASVDLSASLNLGLTLGGSKYETVSASDTATLNTIPRTSKMTSAPDWTAGSNRTVSISRASSSFRHEVEMSVKQRDGAWKWVNQVALSTSQTSKSTEFSENGHKVTFQTLDGRASAQTRFQVQTYSGTTHIGTEDYIGTVTAPTASTISSINGQHGGTNTKAVYFDQEIKFGIARKNADFTHTVIVTAGTFSRTFTNVEASLTFTLTAAEQTSLYNQTKDKSMIDGNIEVKTYYKGELVRESTNADIDFCVKESINKPTFPASAVTYKDTNATTKTITANDQIIVQNKSVLQVVIGTGATMKNGATFSRYIISIDGQELPLTTITGTVNFKPIKGGTNQSLSVKVVDSRGYMTTVSKTVTVLPYSAPVPNVKATRQDLFGENTEIKVSGTFSALSNKNTVTSVQYKVTNKSTGAVVKDWTALAITKTASTFTGTVTQVLDVTMKYNVELRVTDTMATTVNTLVSVEAGQPIFFIDSEKRSLGFNDFPTENNEFRVNGRVNIGSSQFPFNGGLESGYFNVLATGKSMRFIYPKTSHSYMEWADNEGNREAYIGFANDGTETLTISNQRRTTARGDILLGKNTLHLLGTTATYNGEPVFSSTNTVLWSGAVYPDASQTPRPTKKLTDCPNGWILVWSDYDFGSGENDYNIVQTFVHKHQAKSTKWRGGGMYMTVGSTANVSANKYIYVFDDRIEGNDDNKAEGAQRDIVLREVIEW